MTAGGTTDGNTGVFTTGQECRPLEDARRDKPWEVEGGLLAGWEVELPTKTIGGRFTKRETLALTSLPHELAKVMGEAEYLEQVVAIRELTEAHSKRMQYFQLGPMFALVGVVLGFFGPFVLAIPMLSGVITSDLYTLFLLGTVAFAVLAAPAGVLLLMYGCYQVGMAGKTMGYEVNRATSHWEARGIAWRVKTSNPLAVLSGGDQPQVIASYNPRVYVECAPDAIDLFETYGTFPTTGAVPSGIEPYSNYGCFSDADRGSELLSGGPDGTPKFTLAFSAVFFNKVRHIIPKRPMMLRKVMGANEFAEQVGVINRDMDRLTKAWKISYTVFVFSGLLLFPSMLFCLAPPLMWGLLGLDGFWWIPIGSMTVILFVPLIGIAGGLLAAHKTSKFSEERMTSILEQHSARWQSRGIEWYLSDEKYRLRVGGHSIDHTERRVAVSTQQEAATKFQKMGPFPLGEIDNTVCVSYDATTL